MSQESIKSANQPKFDEAKKLNLPLGHWAITSSGPLGAREMREIRDIDIIVDGELWSELEQTYGIKYVDGSPKIDVPGELFDVSGPPTFPVSDDPDPEKPTMDQQIREADVIDGLPFVALKYIVYFKRQQNREKDRADIESIEEYLSSHQE